MAKSHLSSSWYRVAQMRPKLRVHTQIHRQRFRGETWYILQDHQTGQFHRISPAANLMICLMDGQRTVNEIWELVCRRLSDDPPTQDEAIQLLAQLSLADVLSGDVPPDFAEIAERSRQQSRRNLMAKLKNPLALRMPLFDPDAFLNRTMYLFRPLFTVYGFLAWLALVVTGAVLVAVNLSGVTGGTVAQILTAQNLGLIALIYPVVKLIHELGHAYATKAWGGEVHEFGFMFLVLIPLPYVDASASTAFREKRRRAVVGGAGVMVELALAALAAIVWVHVEDGLVRAAAFNVMLIASVSTLLFNGNPLLRFDGYYVLADLLEIPNLGSRSNKYFFYLVQRYLFGVDGLDSPATHPSERKWLIVYAVLAAIYRMFIVLVIAGFIATHLFFVGVLLAIWAVFSSIVMPVLKGIVFLFSNARLRGRRRHAVTVSAAIVAAIWAVLFMVPMPYATLAEGVVYAPPDTVVRAGAEGLVEAIVTSPGSTVEPGRVLVTLSDPSLDARAEVLEAQLAELQLRLAAVMISDRTQTDVLEEQIRYLKDRISSFAEQRRGLSVAAPAAGRFVANDATDLVGRFVRQGDVLGHVVTPASPIVRVAIPQDSIDLVRQRTRSLEVRFAGELDEIRPAVMLREVPAAQRELPSMALSTKGGGKIALDPASGDNVALEGWFLADVQILDDIPAKRLGGRAYVRFDHGTEPVAWRLARGLRQLFLRSFGV